jgi:hypothetical protein
MSFSLFVLVMAFPFSFVLLFGFVAAFGVMAPVLKAQKQAQTMLVNPFECIRMMK